MTTDPTKPSSSLKGAESSSKVAASGGRLVPPSQPATAPTIGRNAIPPTPPPDPARTGSALPAEQNPLRKPTGPGGSTEPAFMPGPAGSAHGKGASAVDDERGVAADNTRLRIDASERRWPRGPDPSVGDPCPIGNKTAAALWRARRAVLLAEEIVAKTKERVSEEAQKERAHYDAWLRRERDSSARATLLAVRAAEVSAVDINALAELAAAKRMTVRQFLDELAGAL